MKSLNILKILQISELWSFLVIAVIITDELWDQHGKGLRSSDSYPDCSEADCLEAVGMLAEKYDQGRNDLVSTGTKWAQYAVILSEVESLVTCKKRNETNIKSEVGSWNNTSGSNRKHWLKVLKDGIVKIKVGIVTTKIFSCSSGPD